MTESKPTPTATSSGPIAREIAEWLRAVRKGWTQSVDEPLSCGWRRFYAFAGSSVWAFGFVLALALPRDPAARLIDFIPDATRDYYSYLLFLSAWFAYLVAFAERRAGPVGLFLDDLLLPAATATIIGFSVGKIQSVREEPRASSESPQDTRPEGPEESSQSPFTFPEIPPEPAQGAEGEDGRNELPD